MDQIEELLTRGVAEVIVEANLRRKLQSGQKLRLKLGVDPSRPSMTIGNGVALRKLRKFQELGHTVVLIVGDWTAQIGDPTGRDETRPRLTPEMVQSNANSFMDQFFKLVDRDLTEVRWQSEWFGTFNLEAAFNLAGRFTLAQMLAHETFRKRYEEGQPLTILELMYPMLQGYDSVVITSDVEFGGTDQKFNILAGRQLMDQMGMVPQDVLLVPLIPGTDGRKMGKSFDNSVDMLMSPEDKYGKLMSMGDSVMPLYYEVWSDMPLEEVREMSVAIVEGTVNPRDLKMRLAHTIVEQIHGREEADRAQAEFVQVFQQRSLPSDMPEHSLTAPTNIVDLLIATGLASSKGEARRLIAGGGVRLNSAKIEAVDLEVTPAGEQILQVGRRKFVKLQTPER